MLRIKNLIYDKKQVSDRRLPPYLLIFVLIPGAGLQTGSSAVKRSPGRLPFLPRSGLLVGDAVPPRSSALMCSPGHLPFCRKAAYWLGTPHPRRNKNLEERGLIILNLLIFIFLVRNLWAGPGAWFLTPGPAPPYKVFGFYDIIITFLDDRAELSFLSGRFAVLFIFLSNKAGWGSCPHPATPGNIPKVRSVFIGIYEKNLPGSIKKAPLK